jgi:hypothetical protein
MEQHCPPQQDEAQAPTQEYLCLPVNSVNSKPNVLSSTPATTQSLPTGGCAPSQLKSHPPQPRQDSSEARPTQGRIRRPIPGTFWEQKWTWLLALTCGISLLLTFIYGWALSSPNGSLGSVVASNTSPTVAIRILRILSEIVSIMLATFVGVASTLTMWLMASTDSGITVATWLAMSPSTGLLGLLRLFQWPRRSRSLSWNLHIPWILIRLPPITDSFNLLDWSSWRLFLSCLYLSQVRKHSLKFSESSSFHHPLTQLRKPLEISSDRRIWHIQQLVD